MSTYTKILKKIEDKTVKVGIIGLGYVGLPLGLEFAEKGISVIGFDIDEKKIPILEKGQTYIKHISASRIMNAVESNKLIATSDFSKISEVDAVLICVPTPLNQNREPDMKYIISTIDVLKKYLRKGQLVTLESTTYPGTTRELILPELEKAPIYYQSLQNDGNGNHSLEPVSGDNETIENYKVGEDFFLAFSPEREDPNNSNYTTATIPKVVGGITDNCVKIATELYNLIIIKTVPVSSPEVAEATKLVENIYRSVNIALVNELKMVFERMNIDIWEVIEAAKTKPFGFNAFYPGPGLGGHCIPIDPFYLTWKAREFEISTKFIELAGEINTFQPYYVLSRTMEALNNVKKSINGARVLILGAAYKSNIDDTRESPSLKLIEILRDKGAEVHYNDPYIPKLPKTRKYHYNLESVELTAENLADYDVVLLSTNHSSYDYDFIYAHSKLIVDTRNAFGKNGFTNGKLVKA